MSEQTEILAEPVHCTHARAILDGVKYLAERGVYTLIKWDHKGRFTAEFSLRRPKAKATPTKAETHRLHLHLPAPSSKPLFYDGSNHTRSPQRDTLRETAPIGGWCARASGAGIL